MTKDAFIAEVTFKVYDLQSVHPPPSSFLLGGIEPPTKFSQGEGGGG